MTPVTQITGVAAPLLIDNIDTDSILPARYLKTIGRAGLRAGLFAGLRHQDGGAPCPDFILDREGYSDTRILVAGRNFGCGSSREHAPWALLDYGITCIVAVDFADIFFANAVNCGLLPAQVDTAVAADLGQRVAERPTIITIDLVTRTLTAPHNWAASFAISDVPRERLLRGLDMIRETMDEEAHIASFETAHSQQLAWSRRTSI